jgi:hypothetical protein
MARRDEFQRWRDQQTGSLPASVTATAAELNQLDGWSPLELTRDNTVLQTKSADYTAVLADAGTVIDFGAASGATFTIPANASVAFPIGTVLIVAKSGANTLTIAITSDTLISLTTPVLAASGGVALFIKAAATTWVCVSGNIS